VLLGVYEVVKIVPLDLSETISDLH
jgi:hypothetical protein